MRVVAHRGNSSVAPQNTLAAFEAACRVSADAVELDVRRTRDGALVVIHDRDVTVTTDGTGRVKDLTLAELRELDAGTRFSPVFAGQRVPELTEVLDLVARYPAVGVFVELKGLWQPDDARRATDAVRSAGLGSRALFQSFRRRTVAALRDAAPDLPRALLVELWTPDVVRACRHLGVTACNPARRLLRERLSRVRELHDAGLEVYPWTLDDPVAWTAVMTVGVEGVITNQPDRLRGWLDGRSLPPSPAGPAGSAQRRY
jgi:glycerophosphoryl diester phosphodiesterase